MTARYDDDRLLSAWLHDTAPSREPEHLLGQVLARTARTHRRAAWRNPERLLPMSAITSRLIPAAPFPWRLLAVATALLLALAIGMVLVAMGTFTVKAPPFGPAANGEIFYSRGGELFAIPVAGPAHRILSTAADDSDPILAPDGTKLAFLRHGDGNDVQAWSMNVDGSNVHQLELPYAEPAWFEWAPQGDAAVVLSDTDRGAMTILSTEGGDASRHALGVTIEQPVFRPAAGAQLSFLGTDATGERGIYLVNRDGSGLRRLDLDAGFSNDQYYAENADSYFWAMSWAPSGDRFFYTQLEPAPDSPAGPGFRNHLVIVDAAGEVVSDRILEFDAGTDDEFAATFLPGEDGMVFQNLDGDRHWMSFAPLGPDGSVGPARDLGVSATDWITFHVSPDGTSLLAVLPAAAGAAPVAYLVDLATGAKTEIEVGADAAWQRVAP